MIIKSYRLRAVWSLRRFGAHIFRGRENERITVVRGTERDLLDWQRAARAAGRAYGIRHFIVAPERELSVEQLLLTILTLANEFGFDPEIVVAVVHEKARRTGTGLRHLHLLVPEVDPVDGGVLSSSHDFARQEKLARRLEFQLGHPLHRGRHLKAVYAALKAASDRDLRRALRTAFPDLTQGTKESITSPGIAKAKRLADVDLPLMRTELQGVWSTTHSVAEIEAALARFGCHLAVGEKADIVLVKHGDTGIGSLPRLLKEKKAIIATEFAHVIHANSAESREGDFSGHSVHSPDARSGDEPSRGKRRQRSNRPSRSNSNVHPESVGRHQAQLGRVTSPDEVGGPAAVPSAPALLRLRIGLSSAADNLSELAMKAEALAVSELDRWMAWISGSLSELAEERRKLLAGPPLTTPRLEELEQSIETTKDVLDQCRADAEIALNHLKSHKDTERRWGRSFLRWFRARPDASRAEYLEKVCEAAANRVKDHRARLERLSSSQKEERDRIRNRRENAAADRTKNLSLVDQRIAYFESLRARIVETPRVARGGRKAFDDCIRAMEWSDDWRPPAPDPSLAP